MNEDVKKQVKQVITAQCKERTGYEVGSKEKIQNDSNLVKMIQALNEMEKIEVDKQHKENELAFDKEKFELEKSVENSKLVLDDKRVTIEDKKVSLEDKRIDKDVEARKYESDHADKRAELEKEAAIEKIEAEKKSNIFKTIIYGLGILAGVALHLGDVNAEKELGYDVDDRVSSFDKLKNDLKFFSK